MSREFTFCMRVALGVVVLLAVSADCALADDAAPDSTLEIIQYKAPAGWTFSDKGGPSGRLYVAPDSNASQDTAILVLLAPQQDKLDLRAAFEGIAKQMTQNGKVVESSEVSTTKTRQGYDALYQTLTADVAAGQRLSVRIIAANVNNRMAAFCYLSSSKDLYEKHQPEMDAFLKSVNFTAGGAAAGAGDAEYAALEKEKQGLLARVATIETRQRQIKGGSSAAGAAGGGANGVPIGHDDVPLAKAIEQFARDVDHRKKAHTILGDVLTLDGKPIPNVMACGVRVSGTTIAAERTAYLLEVDKKGHFELQVPDGLYRLYPTCTVTLNGHQVPVDLVPSDGRKQYSDQSSADGIVKDFRLVTNTLKPEADPNTPESYFGGVIAIDDPTYSPAIGDISHRHPGAKIRVNFQPMTAAVDGSKVESFSVESSAEARIRRLPLAAYRLSAALVNPDGSTLPLTCSFTFDRDFNASVEMNWDAVRGSPDQRTEGRLYVRD